MAESIARAKILFEHLSAKHPVGEWNARLSPDTETRPTAMPMALAQSKEDVQGLLDKTVLTESAKQHLLDPHTEENVPAYLANIENFIGTVKLPVGIIGPLRIRGSAAHGDYTVPLATHEAALVASYHRGALAVSDAGGCTAVVLNEGVSRVPCLSFANLREAAAFLAWAVPRQAEFKEIAETTTRHGKLIDLKLTVEGSNVFLHFEFTTGDAAGQNMVTVATQAVLEHILKHGPIPPKRAYVESNLSGDKKASAISFSTVRGKKVTCEVLLPASVLKSRLGVTAEEMEDYWRVSAIGGVLSGSMGVQGHYANGLAALFIACGQDAACVAEASIGVTRFESREDALYAAVTLPNLIVGTVGGGTGLPSQQACLQILDLPDEGQGRIFAEICAATALAGELSIIAALASGNFTRAHKILARRRKLKKQS